MAKKILVIEDNPEIVDMMLTMLEISGYETDFAYNGLDGLKRAREGSPDLILLDVMMPGMNGYEVLKKLKGESGLSKIPVFIVSVKALDDDIRSGKEKGADEYIVKPFEPKTLISLIERYLK